MHDVQTAVAPLHPPPAALQRLVDACRAVLDGSGTPPAAAAVSFVCSVIDKIGPDDVGLSDEIRFFNETNPPILTCKTIYECNNFAITVFLLPPRASMPIHDHPGLTVFTKLLLGSAHVVSFDWVRPAVVSTAPTGPTGVTGTTTPMMLAEKVVDGAFTAASGAWALFPDAGGNMHRFVAGEDGPCAFLDVITPPYSPARQGPCGFYQDLPYDLHRPEDYCGEETEEQKRRRLAWLRKIDEPEDLRISNLPYRGPPIV